MQIVGRSTATLAEVYRHRLGHGEDPYRAARLRGYVIQRALATRREHHDITLELLVSPAGDEAEPPRAPRTRSVAHGAQECPVVRQRIAAYTIVVSARGVLATQFSDLVGASGMWGLPGGGVEPGEEPHETVVREAYEETGQDLVDPRLLDVQSDHWIGRAPSGVLEDFHAVRLVFTGQVHEPSDPVVHDAEGTTSDACWVDLEHWRDLPWTGGARALLEKHLENCVTGFAVEEQQLDSHRDQRAS